MPLPLRNLLFLLMALWALQPLGGWAAQAGVIQSVDGRARVWERSGLERPAQPNVQVFEGDTVASAAGSHGTRWLTSVYSSFVRTMMGVPCVSSAPT